MFDKGEFRKEATPRRVFAFLKLIEYKDRMYTKEEVIDIIQPKNLNNDQNAVSKVIKFCLDEKFVKLSIDDKLELNINKEYIRNEVEFRKYVNSVLYENADKSIFVALNKEILSFSSDIYEISGFSNIAEHIKSMKVNEEIILAWRFWAAYLGYGFILGSQFVTNPYIRINDILEIYFKDSISTQMKLGDFISKLVRYSPEFSMAIDKFEINTNITIALETLSRLNIIKLSKIPDATENFALRKENTSTIVTHIEYLGGDISGK